MYQKSLGGVFLATICALLFAPAQSSAALITSVTDPTTNFNTVPFPNQNDFFNDQQTGQGGADIVGDATNSGFYSAYDGTYLYYRVRFGATDGNGQNVAFSGLFWVGIDGNSDGVIDLFLGVNNQGSTKVLQFVSAGTGANNSPSTTSIGTAQAQYQIAESATNFNYGSVTTTLQPGVTNTDLNGDSKTDSFLTFRVAFAGASGTPTLQGAMLGIAGINLTANSPLSYVIATSTQSNSLNQDIGGLPKNFDGTQTWTALGAITPALTLSGTPPPVPEPGTVALCASGLALGIAGYVRRRRS